MNWKKIPYYIPGVGLATHTVREYKLRKGKNPWYNLKEPRDRKALANYLVQVGYLSFAILWKVYVGSYLGKGINTGDWHPFRFDSKNETELNIEDKIESTIEDKIKKSNSLESIFR